MPFSIKGDIIPANQEDHIFHNPTIRSFLEVCWKDPCKGETVGNTFREKEIVTKKRIYVRAIGAQTSFF